MTETLTTAEVRLAATTNEDLPLTQYKKLEKGFDEWLEAVIAEARVGYTKVAISNAGSSSVIVGAKKQARTRNKKRSDAITAINSTGS